MKFFIRQRASDRWEVCWDVPTGEATFERKHIGPFSSRERAEYWQRWWERRLRT